MTECDFILSLATNSKEDDRKEYLALTSVTSDQSSEVKALGGDHGNLTINYQSVPIADAAKTPENGEEKEKKVNCALFSFSPNETDCDDSNDDKSVECVCSETS